MSVVEKYDPRFFKFVGVMLTIDTDAIATGGHSDSEYVHIAGAELITGAKTFQAGLKVSAAQSVEGVQELTLKSGAAHAVNVSPGGTQRATFDTNGAFLLGTTATSIGAHVGLSNASPILFRNHADNAWLSGVFPSWDGVAGRNVLQLGEQNYGQLTVAAGVLVSVQVGGSQVAQWNTDGSLGIGSTVLGGGPGIVLGATATLWGYAGGVTALAAIVSGTAAFGSATFPSKLQGSVVTISGAVTMTAGETAQITDTNNTATVDVVTLIHKVSNTAGANIGAGLLFQAQNSTGGIVDAGRIAGTFSNATAGSEAGTLDFFTRNGGAENKRLWIGAAGGVHIGVTQALTVPGIALADSVMVNTLGTGTYASTYLTLAGSSGGTIYLSDPRVPTYVQGQSIVLSLGVDIVRIDAFGTIIVGSSEGQGSTPTVRTIRAPKPAGTNIAGAPLQFAGGPGSGSGIPGGVIFQVATAVASGSGTQTPTECGRWDGNSRSFLIGNKGDGTAGNPVFPGAGLGLAFGSSIAMVNSAGTGLLSLVTAGGSNNITLGDGAGGNLGLQAGPSKYIDFNNNGTSIARLFASQCLSIGSTTDSSKPSIVIVQASAMPAAIAGCGIIGFRDNGSGKMQFCVQFPTGAVEVIATEL